MHSPQPKKNETIKNTPTTTTAEYMVQFITNEINKKRRVRYTQYGHNPTPLSEKKKQTNNKTKGKKRSEE